MSNAYGLYGHIRANRTRSTILIGGLFFLIYLLVFAFTLAFNGVVMGGENLETILGEAWIQFFYLLPFSTLGGALWVLIGYKFHQRMIDMSTGAKDVSRDEEPDLYNTLENLCISRGIPLPKLQVI
jgi:heat shock protein HtpX